MYMKNFFDFDEKIRTPLCELMTYYGSDKGEIGQHNYTSFYYHLFNDKQNEVGIRLFELGLGTTSSNFFSNMSWKGSNYKPGASLYGWSDFFPNSNIYGADLDKNILFNTDNIKTFFCDQTNPDLIKSMWENPELQENFDIIIDDGYHDFNANICFFENSIHKLKLGGYYIIEDLASENLYLYENKIKELEITYVNMIFKIISYQKLSDNLCKNNNLLVVYKNTDKLLQ